ncbi:MAG: hypothetical protein Q9P01_05275 [Anaerolineae bacterium]|nr:hypothetical protein [Anaerolineae bacterium]
MNFLSSGLREQFCEAWAQLGKLSLMVADGGYMTRSILWKYLPDGVILMARSAKNACAALSAA